MRRILLFCFCAQITMLIPLTANAQAKDAITLNTVESLIEISCDEEVVSHHYQYSSLFSEYDKELMKYALMACRSIYAKEPELAVSDYWDTSQQKALLDHLTYSLSETFNINGQNAVFSTLQPQLQEWEGLNSFTVEKKDNLELPNLPLFGSSEKGFTRRYWLNQTDGRVRSVTDSDRYPLTAEQNGFCNQRWSKACAIAFNEYNTITERLSVFQRFRISDEFKKYTGVKKAEWDTFSDNSRFMTFIDVLATSWYYSDQLSLSTDVTSPPPLQWFALRPSFVFEHLNNAPNGNRDEVGLAIEWVGFNDWKLDIPLGVSLASVYADRESGKSIGHGLMFHVNNDYSIGWAYRSGGHHSIYFNLELRDWFGGKQNLRELFN